MISRSQPAQCFTWVSSRNSDVCAVLLLHACCVLAPCWPWERTGSVCAGAFPHRVRARGHATKCRAASAAVGLSAGRCECTAVCVQPPGVHTVALSAGRSECRAQGAHVGRGGAAAGAGVGKADGRQVGGMSPVACSAQSVRVRERVTMCVFMRVRMCMGAVTLCSWPCFESRACGSLHHAEFAAAAAASSRQLAPPSHDSWRHAGRHAGATRVVPRVASVYTQCLPAPARPHRACAAPLNQTGDGQQPGPA